MARDVTPFSYVCPACRQPLRALAAGEEPIVCASCARAYARALTLPVFYPEQVGSRERLERVLTAYPSTDWLGLLPLLHRAGHVPRDSAAARRWADRRIERHERFYEMFRRRAQEIWPARRGGTACEIGCGQGDGLIALARDFDHVLGVDVSLPALVAASKLVAERGLSNVTLAQASAHELPFEDGAFDYVQAINVIEHVFRPEHFFGEIKRVLSAGGVFCGDSRNRFDLFFPEPHVSLMWVGFLPRRLMDRYVRLRRGFGYGGKHLLSYFELERAITHNFGQACRIVLPDVGAYSARAPAVLRRAVESLHARPSLERAALPAFPTHIALARG